MEEIHIDMDEEHRAPHKPHMVEPESTKKEYAKLFGIFLLIGIAATLMSTLVEFNWEEWMRWFMGGFFIVFGSFKLIGYEMFVMMFPSYDLIAKRFKPYAYIYPFIELFLGLLYLANQIPVFRDIATIVILTIGAIGVLKTLARSGSIRCACLGNIIKLPLSTVTLIEDIGMAVMALIMLISHFTL